MALFEIYTTEVEINGDIYKLRPLSGRHIGKLYSVIGKLQGEDEKEIASKLNEETMGGFYDIAVETFKKSYPNEEESKVEEFVSQNLQKLIEPIIKVNVGEANKQE